MSDPIVYHYECSGSHMPSTVSDHHPLTRAGVEELLKSARRAYENRGRHHPAETASIQIRLSQAIPGQQCPRPVKGEVADADGKMGSFYVNWLQSGAGVSRDIVDAMCNIIGVDASK